MAWHFGHQRYRCLRITFSSSTGAARHSRHGVSTIVGSVIGESPQRERPARPGGRLPGRPHDIAQFRCSRFGAARIPRARLEGERHASIWCSRLETFCLVNTGLRSGTGALPTDRSERRRKVGRCSVRALTSRRETRLASDGTRCSNRLPPSGSSGE